MSLKSVAKRTRGIHGRAPPTNISDFKTWDAFEEEVSFIWRNAKEYNEDGSDMYNLAIEFEVRRASVVYFNKCSANKRCRSTSDLF